MLKTVGRQVMPARGHRPAQGLLPRAGDHPPGGQGPRDGPRRAARSDAARDRGLFQATYVDALLAEPNGELTPLRGNKLWQLGLLELWLQSHDIS